MNFPHKYRLFDVDISKINYKELTEIVISAAKNRSKMIVDHMPVHGLITASLDPEFRRATSGFDIIAPDGQPVCWALNILYNAGISDRVYGPTFMKILCNRISQEGIGIYLFGSDSQTLNALNSKLLKKYPLLKITGLESPPFRPFTDAEEKQIIQRINDSGAEVVFVGLGCPKQEIFSYKHRESIQAVQICVGAAFDFIANTKKQAPAWMQKNGLEWLYRMASEPRRLWKRYLIYNSIFIIKFLKELFLKRSNLTKDR